MQPAARRESDLAVDLSDNGAETHVTQCLLHHEEHGRRVAGFDVDDPIWMDPDAGERRRKQISATECPNDGPGRSRQDPARKTDGRGAVDEIRAAAINLMNGTQHEAAGRESAVDLIQPKRKRRQGTGRSRTELLCAHKGS